MNPQQINYINAVFKNLLEYINQINLYFKVDDSLSMKPSETPTVKCPNNSLYSKLLIWSSHYSYITFLSRMRD